VAQVPLHFPGSPSIRSEQPRGNCVAQVVRSALDTGGLLDVAPVAFPPIRIAQRRTPVLAVAFGAIVGDTEHLAVLI
jgi:hypothetical protein